MGSDVSPLRGFVFVCPSFSQGFALGCFLSPLWAIPACRHQCQAMARRSPGAPGLRFPIVRSLALAGLTGAADGRRVCGPALLLIYSSSSMAMAGPKAIR